MHLKWKVLIFIIWNAIATFLMGGGILSGGITSVIGGFMYLIELLYLLYKIVQHLIWKPFKNVIIVIAKIDLYFIYLVIRLPIWLFIQLPLYYLFTGAGRIEQFFQQGLASIHHEPKKALAATLPGIAFYLFLFPPRYLDPLSAGAWTNYASTFFFILLASVASSFVLMKIYHKISGVQVARRDMPGSAVDTPGQAVQGAKQNLQQYGQKQAQQAVETAQAGQKVYDTGRDIHDILKIFAMILSLIPGVNVGALGAGMLVFLGILVIIGAFLIQFFVVMFFFILFVKALIPLVAGPLLKAMGLGQAYTSFFGEAVADQYIAGNVPSIGLEEQVAVLMEAKARVNCLFKGPECLMAMRMNNTQRPDSQDVGERYELVIQDFRLGSGKQVDVAYQPRSYQVPISFTLYNTRQGFKGIPAYNVSYRLKMIDFDNPEKDPYCNTGWVPVDGFDLRKNDREPYTGNDLPAGGYATTQFLRLSDKEAPKDGFTLQDCGMLQPGIGEFRKAKLSVKYEYSSSAHLYFEAKSRRAASPPKKKKGRTTDTPVKIDMSIQSPLTYSQRRLEELRRSGGDTSKAAQPRTVQLSFDTDKGNARYQVNDITVTKPGETCIFDQKRGGCASFGPGNGASDYVEAKLSPKNDLSCIFRPVVENGRITDRMQLTDRAKKNFIPGFSGGIPDDHWFTKERPPSFMGCPLGLKNPSSINPEGESLYMKARANYTVRLSKPLEGFKLLNSRCNAENCPFIVPPGLIPKSMSEDARKHVRTRCKGQYALDGCSIVDPGSDWSSATVIGKMEKGEQAFTWSSIYDNDWEGFKEIIEFHEQRDSAVNIDYIDLLLGDKVSLDFEGYSPLTISVEDKEFGRTNETIGIGLDPEKLEKKGGKAIVAKTSRDKIQDVRVAQVEPRLCSNYRESGKGDDALYTMANVWKAKNYPGDEYRVLFFWPREADNCANTLFHRGTISFTRHVVECTAQKGTIVGRLIYEKDQCREGIKDIGCQGVDVVRGTDPYCYEVS